MLIYKFHILFTGIGQEFASVLHFKDETAGFGERDFNNELIIFRLYNLLKLMISNK